MGQVLDDLCNMVLPALAGLLELSAEMCCVLQRYAPTGCLSLEVLEFVQAGRAMVGAMPSPLA
jgi:hypothetical protein